MAEVAIRTRNLTRYFGAKRAVHALDLEVPTGTVFGFLGRNGSGKTTTLRMLLGLLEPTRGSATILGADCTRIPTALRARIGYLTEGHYVPGWMRAQECGRFQAKSYAKWSDAIFQSVLRHFSIDPKARAKDLSRGERAGLCLALTLAPDPELLVLDDPALGLDPVVRRSLIESMLFVTRRDGRTVLFSSHLLADVERVADYVAILDHGELRACCTLETLRARVRQVVLHFKAEPPALPPIPGLLCTTRLGHEISLAIANYDGATEKILGALPTERIDTVPATLEDVFISYVGKRGERNFFYDVTQNKNAEGAA